MTATAPATAFPPWRTLPVCLSQLSLPIVLRSGQSFRWSHHPTYTLSEPAEFSYALPNRTLILRQLPAQGELHYRSIPSPADPDEDERWLRDYLSLDVDLKALYEEWAGRDSVFAEVRRLGRFEGVTMLRQPPWECLVSFICSSNNNIPRITLMISRLSSHFSPAHPSVPAPYAAHPFPPPSVLATPTAEQTLRELGFGYRAKYVVGTARMLLDDAHGKGSDEGALKWLKALRKRPGEEVREELIKFAGVGPKVGDCVALMCLDQRDAIPVDTHVWQIAVRDYAFLSSPYAARAVAPSASPFPSTKNKKPRKPAKLTKDSSITPAVYKAVGDMFRDRWGEWAGWAHSVLFAADLKAFQSPSSPPPTPSPSEAPSIPAASATLLSTTTAVPATPSLSSSPTPTPANKRRAPNTPAARRAPKRTRSGADEEGQGPPSTPMKEEKEERDERDDGPYPTPRATPASAAAGVEVGGEGASLAERIKLRRGRSGRSGTSGRG